MCAPRERVIAVPWWTRGEQPSLFSQDRSKDLLQGTLWVASEYLIICWYRALSQRASAPTPAPLSLVDKKAANQSLDSPASWGQLALETQQSCIPDSQWEAREKADFHIYKVSKVQMALFFFLLHWRMGKTGLCIRVSWNSEHVG